MSRRAAEVGERMKLIDRLLAAFGLVRSSEAVRCSALLAELGAALSDAKQMAKASETKAGSSYYWHCGEYEGLERAIDLVRGHSATART